VTSHLAAGEQAVTNKSEAATGLGCEGTSRHDACQLLSSEFGRASSACRVHTFPVATKTAVASRGPTPLASAAADQSFVYTADRDPAPVHSESRPA